MKTAAPDPPLRRIVLAGLVAGLVVNVVDIPNSAIVVSPRWTAFLGQHGIVMDIPLVSVFYTLLHLAYGIGLAYAYTVARARFGGGTATALATALFLLVLHRAFGFGMVVMGTMPLGIYAMFSASMTLGTLLGGVAAGKLIDRALPP
jgi:hypothetical protein